MDEGRMEKFIPGRWKGEGGGVDRKRLLGHANALWTARWRRKQQTLFVAALEERARMQFQEGRKRLEGFRQTGCLCAAGSVAEMWSKRRGQPTSGEGGGIPEC